MAQSENESLDVQLSNMKLLSYEVGSQFYAKPTYIVDPHNFYIIPFSVRQHLETLTRIKTPVKMNEMKVNMVVIFTSHKPDLNEYFKLKLDQNVRGIILNINKEEDFQIYALDYGFVEDKVSIDRIFHPLYKDALEIPGLAKHCELDLCAPKGPKFSNDAIEAFKYYIGNEKLSVVVKGLIGEKLKVCIYNSNPDDIATLLALTHYTLLTSSSGISKTTAVFVTLKPKLLFKYLRVRSREKLFVRVQSGSLKTNFYVSTMEAYNNYLLTRSPFTNYCTVASPISDEAFEPHTIVGVKDNLNLYYERAIIMSVTEKDARVKLVDWGLEKVVPREEIKEIQTEVFTVDPVAAIFCRAVKDSDTQAIGFPPVLREGYSFTITVLIAGQGFESPHIVLVPKIGVALTTR